MKCWVRVENTSEIPNGVRLRWKHKRKDTTWRYYSNARTIRDRIYGNREHDSDVGLAGGIGAIWYGPATPTFIDVEYEEDTPDVITMPLSDVPVGGVYHRNDPSFSWVRVERPGPMVYARSLWDYKANSAAYASIPTDVVTVIGKFDFQEEKVVIDILTASKGQLIELAVEKWGEDQRENALRTRLEQLRESLQKEETPEWWSFGSGKVRSQNQQGKGKGGNQQQDDDPPKVLAKREKAGPCELTGEELAELVEPFLSPNQVKAKKALEAAAAEVEKQMAKMVDAAVEHKVPKPTEVVLTDPKTGKQKDLGKTHRNVPELIHLLSMNLNVMLVGPAGSFKTSSAELAAKALNLPFYMTSVGMQTSKADLLGYQDAHGRTIRTHLRNAYENGGLFLLDEADAGNANVLTVINALLANNVAAFPDAMVQRHKDFRFVAAANTFGRGADREYVGRNQLDAATLDRFVTLYWDYDEEFELYVAGADQGAWVRHVQSVRKAVQTLKVRHIISPRASIFGATALRNGMPRERVEELVLWGSMSKDDRTKVLNSL